MGWARYVTADGHSKRVEGPISLCEAIALDGPLAASLQRLYDSIPTALGVIGCDGRYLSANTMYAAIYDVSPRQVVGCPVGDYAPSADEQLREDFAKFDAGVGMIEREIACRGRYCLEALLPLHGSEGRVLGPTLSLVDITARKRMEQALEKVSRDREFRASHDHLTGLPNRRHIDRALVAESRRSARTGLPLSVLMSDVDFFRKYNDHVGHQPGDDCLRAIAAQLRGPGSARGRPGGPLWGRRVRRDSPGCRCVQRLSHCREHAAGGARTRHRASAQPIRWRDLEHWRGDAANRARRCAGRCDNLLGHVDHALYSAKAAGLNAVHAYQQQA